MEPYKFSKLDECFLQLKLKLDRWLSRNNQNMVEDFRRTDDRQMGFYSNSIRSNAQCRGNELSRTLLVTIHYILYPITVEVLNQVFSPYGIVEKIVILPKLTGFQARVQYQLPQSAVSAITVLQGRNIYDDCCQLDLQFVSDLGADVVVSGNENKLDVNGVIIDCIEPVTNTPNSFTGHENVKETINTENGDDGDCNEDGLANDNAKDTVYAGGIGPSSEQNGISVLNEEHFKQMEAGALKTVVEEQPFESIEVTREQAIEVFSENNFTVESTFPSLDIVLQEVDGLEKGTDPSFDNVVQRALVVDDHKGAVAQCIAANEMAGIFIGLGVDASENADMRKHELVDNDFFPFPAKECKLFGVSFPYRSVLGVNQPTSRMGEMGEVLKYLKFCSVISTDGLDNIDHSGSLWWSSGSLDNGTSEDLTYLIDKAHSLGLQILMDDVYNQPSNNVIDRLNGYLFPKEKIRVWTQIISQVIPKEKWSPLACNIGTIGRGIGNLMAREIVEGYNVLLEKVLKLPSKVLKLPSKVVVPKDAMECLLHLAFQARGKFVFDRGRGYGKENIDGYSFTAMIDGLCKQGRVKLANGLVAKMIKKGIEPIEVTITTIIKGFCKSGNTGDTLKLFKMMIANGCLKTCGVFSLFLHVLSKECKLIEGYAEFGKIPRHGLVPSVVTNTKFAGAFFQAGKVDQSLSMMELIKQVGCPPNVYTYSVKVNGRYQNGKVEEAEKILHSMSGLGVSPNYITYNIWVKAFIIAGQLDCAPDVMGFMINELIKCTNFNELL